MTLFVGLFYDPLRMDDDDNKGHQEAMMTPKGFVAFILHTGRIQNARSAVSQPMYVLPNGIHVKARDDVSAVVRLHNCAGSVQADVVFFLP